LSCVARKGIERGEKEHKVQWLMLKDLCQSHAHIHFCRQCCLKVFFAHVSKTLIEQHNGRMDHAMNLAKVALDLFIGLLKFRKQGGISADVMRSWS